MSRPRLGTRTNMIPPTLKIDTERRFAGPTAFEGADTFTSAARRSTGNLQHVGAVVRFVQESSLHDEAQHLFVGHALIGLLGQGGDFPQHDTKRPVTDAKRHERTYICVCVCVCSYPLQRCREIPGSNVQCSSIPLTTVVIHNKCTFESHLAEEYTRHCCQPRTLKDARALTDAAQTLCTDTATTRPNNTHFSSFYS